MKKLLFLSLLLVLVLGPVACGRTEIPGNYNAAPDEGSYSSVQATPPATPMPTRTSVFSPGSPSGGSASYDGAPAPERMVILSAYMSLVVDDVSASVSQISSLAG